MIFRLEPRVLGQSFRFGKSFCSQPFVAASKAARERAEQEEPPPREHERKGQPTLAPTAQEQGGERASRTKETPPRESTREVSAYTPILLFTSDVSCNRGLRFGWGGGRCRGRTVQASFFHTVLPGKFLGNFGKVPGRSPLTP